MKENKVRILAVNGSPRGARGNTERILQPFLEGAREAGAETETVYLRDKEISPCLGCFTCWTKTPGVCIHQDDMPELLEKVRGADMMVYATPLYVFTVTAQMKAFMDRHLPLLDPHILERGEDYTHPPRYESGLGGVNRVVLISNCGFPERHHFSGLVETFRCFTADPDSELIGTILCAAGEMLGQAALRDQFRWYLDAARQAGREVVEEGHIAEETQEVLDRLLIDPAVYARMANAYWDGLLAPQQAGSGEAEGDRPLPPPTGRDTMRDLVAGMAMVFNPKAAGDLEAVIQFDVTGGEEPETYYLDIAGGDCRAYEGVHPDPNLTITTPADVWIAISEGELDGQRAFMEQKYTANGDFSLLMKLDSLFSAA